MKYLAIITALFITSACTSKKDISGCYEGNIKKDTVALTLNTDEQYTGTLTYNFFEKDDNTGTVKGELHGDSLLLMDYTHNSEGQESVRQVAFIINSDGSLTEAHGEMINEGEKLIFKDKSQLNSEHSFTLRKKDCE
ncbi:hypothetical protein [Fulvivirga ligni]|uniref:hypothetical protein n=1 Tax=Fulvivirga ligni TaxID=2904246 RepID=UPI001F2DD56D|nr:hypothetical protein [Fulvivirga ligni]UII20988.1 hypothetical protein LVD16_24390 [Fulvivirga ligni]